MILDFIHELGPWNWLVGGLILLGLELVVPGASLIWFGTAALIVGVLALAAGIAWQTQAILFVVLAIVLVVVGRRFFSAKRSTGDSLLLNERAERLVDRSFRLTDPIVNGVGRIKVDDGTWGVVGPDLPSGALVRVIGHDGTVLKVVAAPKP